MCSAPTLGSLSSDSDREDGVENEDHNDPEDIATNTSDSSHGEEDTGAVSLRTE